MDSDKYVWIPRDLGFTKDIAVALLARFGCPYKPLFSDEPASDEIRAQVEVLIAKEHTVNKATLEPWPNARLVSCAFTGIDGVDQAMCRDRGTAVYFVPDYSKTAVAELAVGLTIAVLRKLVQADKDARAGCWDRAVAPGIELHGKTVGIVGTGLIGCESAKRFVAFGCRILGWSRTAREAFVAAGGQYVNDIQALLREADVVVLHLPASAETHRYIDAAKFAAMKPSAVLINVARAAIVDTTALVEALRKHRIAGAGIDVFDTEPLTSTVHPLQSLGNAVLCPHIGFKTDVSLNRLREAAIENIGRFTRGDAKNRLIP